MTPADLFRAVDRALRANQDVPERRQPVADGTALARCLWRYYGPQYLTTMTEAIDELDRLARKEAGEGDDPYPGETFDSLIRQAEEKAP